MSTPRGRFTRRQDRRSAATVPALLAALVAGLVASASAQAPEDPLRFTRVHVPAGRLADVDMGAERYVPLPLAEFERAVAALADGERAGDAAAAMPLRVLADTARVTGRFDAAGRLTGRLSFTMPDGGAGYPTQVSLGNLQITRASRETTAGTGPTVVHALRSGPTAIVLPGPGNYRCDFALPAAESGARWRAAGVVERLPLVPAVRTVVELGLPAGQRPCGGGAEWVLLPAEPAPAGAPSPAAPPAEQTWRTTVGPRSQLVFGLLPADAQAPGARVWTVHRVGREQTRVETMIQPTAPWAEPRLALRVDPHVTLLLASVADGSGGRRDLVWQPTGDGAEVILPPGVLGTAAEVEIVGIAPALTAQAAELPVVAVAADAWCGGGVTVRLDPGLALTGLTPDDAVVVSPPVAATWPWPREADPDSGALVHLAAQGPRAGGRVTLEPRGPSLDIARVTAVDVATARVLGVATCDVRVDRGEAFALTGRVGPGWIIDAVEWVEPVAPVDDAALGTDVSLAGLGDELLDWRVSADAGGSLLRMGLAAAATPQRPLGLRITGHRAGADVGVPFPVRDLEMVVLDGETDGQTALALRAAPDTTLEIDPPPPAAPAPGIRLQALAGQGPVRSWLPAGVGLPAAEARLVQRRPPIAVHARIGLSVRDDRLAESFTLECRPGESPLDAAVIHFSEPIEDQLEWTLLPPAVGSVVARPLEMAGRRGGETSWLVEFVPPVRDPVSIRATRSVALDGATAVPLVRVDGAVDLVGDVVVRTTGRRRPAVVNRRLTELPPGPAAPGTADDVIAEFGFDATAAESASTDGAALEIVPDAGGGDRAARAWVWSEVVDCWCHRSGRTEFESRFDIENHGRGSLTLVLPPGKRLLGILLDGRRVMLDAETVGGEVTIDLPIERRRLTLVVRTMAEEDAESSWMIDSGGGAVDLPVLERSWRVWLPPGVEIAAGPAQHREVAPSQVDWGQRLFGFPLNRPTASPADREEVDRRGGLVAGCVEHVFVPLPGRPAADRLRLVASRDIERAALLAGTFLAGCLLLAAAWRPGLLVVVPLVAGLVALWVPAPWHVPARAVWWATLAVGVATLVAGRRSAARRCATVVLPTLALVGLAWSGGSARAADEGAVERVFITPVGGVPTALVPERLFDRLGAVTDETAPRVVAARVELPAPEADPGWRVTLEIDADAGTSLWLPFPGQATGPADGMLIDGRPATVLPAGPGTARLPIAEAGRHRVEWTVAPFRVRRGDLVVSMIALPPAPQAVLATAPGGLAAEPLVEVARPGGPFMAALPDAAWSVGEPPRFDVAGADRIAMVTAAKPGVRLTAVPRSARSRNDVAWGASACRLVSRFDVDAGESLLPAVVLRADPRLVPEAADEPSLEIDRLGSGRFRVVRPEPVAGDFRVEVAWTMPLDEPTGVFTVPEVWLEAPLADERFVRLQPDAGLRVGLLPSSGSGGGTRPALPGGELSWRADTAVADAAPGTGDGLAPGLTPPGATRVAVTRAPAVVRASQQLRLGLGQRRVDMALQARIEAEAAVVASPLSLPADVQLGKVILTDETSTEGPRQPLDIRLVREAPADPASGRSGLTVVLQQPRAGRLRLEAEAILPGPVPAEGLLPVMRLALDGASPVVVSWTAANGLAAEVAGGEAAAAGVAELAAGDEAPPYRLVGVPLPPLDAASGPSPATDVAAAPDAGTEEPGGPRLELVDAHLAIDARGRAWGTVRIDLVANDPVVRLSLPAGMRPFKVFIDGRATADPRPVGPAAAPLWEVRLLDVRWPRSFEVVFAGDLGAALGSGRLVALEAPGIAGLTAARCLWTIAVPRGTEVRVAPPATAVTAATAAVERTAAFDRLAGDFARAIAAASPGEAGRLGDLLGARRGPPSLPAADPGAADGAGEAPVFVTGATIIAPPGKQRVEIRLVRGADHTASGRALASLVLLLAAAVAAAVGRWRTRGKTA
jgi:hypothetical protein